MINLFFLLKYFVFCFLLFSSCSFAFFGESFRGQRNAKAFVAPFYSESSFVVTSAKDYSNNAKSRLNSYNLDGEIISGALQPLSGMVLIQRKESKKTTRSGLYIASDSKDRQVIGKVLSVGDPMSHVDTGATIPMEVSVGDWVLIGKNDGHNLKYNEKDCVIVRADEILGKINESEGVMQPNNIQPFGDVVFVKISTKETISGGIIIAENKGKTPNTGEVVAVGQGAFDQNGKRLPMDVKPGDLVRFSSYFNEEMSVKFGDECFMFVRLREIIARW